MGLKKWQRNAIFEAVRRAGLSPEEFDWDHGADESKLRHRPSGAYFIFGGHAGAYTSRYLAGDAPIEERTKLSKYRLDQQVELWLSAVRRTSTRPTCGLNFSVRASCWGSSPTRRRAAIPA